jgi:hypothetical protein
LELHLAAGFGHARFDAVNVVADVHAIGHGAFVVVFGDAVLRWSDPVDASVGIVGNAGPEAISKRSGPFCLHRARGVESQERVGES